MSDGEVCGNSMFVSLILCCNAYAANAMDKNQLFYLAERVKLKRKALA